MTITRRLAVKRSASAGFSLIEMSVIVAVLGLLAVTMLTSGLIGREKYRLTETEEKMEKIKAAVQVYYNRTGFLPCPASGSELPDTANFGTSTNCAAGAVAGVTDVAQGGNEDLRIGVVPTRTLVLPDSFMNDEWGNRFSFVVVKKLATDATSFNNFTTVLTTGVIQLKDEAGAQIGTASATNVNGYVLVSHGKDKKGAYSKQGSVGYACGAVATALDADNCDNNAAFVQAEINDDEGAAAAFYYDLVKYVSTKELKDGAGTTTSSSTSSTSGADPTPPPPASPTGNGEGGGSGSGSSSGGPGGSPNAGVSSRSCLMSRPISVQSVFSCAVGDDKRLYCSGGQGVGQLGDGLTTVGSTTPKEVVGSYTDWALLDTSQAAACAVRESGEAYCWGDNSTGKLGNGTTTNASVPTLISGGFTNWVYVDSGVNHSCGLRANGTAYCWGENTDGEVGDGTTTQRLVPTEVTGSHSDWSFATAGWNSSCGLRGGRIFCWGINTNGQLGDGTNTTSSTPVEIAGGFSDWSRVWANRNYVCGIRSGRGYCWGQNSSGQLGIGSTTSMNVPTEIAGAHTNWSIITGDDRSTCGIRSGAAYCWGLRDYGRVGDGGATTGNQTSPAPVTGGYTDFVHIATSPEHSCGARDNGSIFCWGRNNVGEFGVGTTTDSATPIAAFTGIAPKTCGFGADCSYTFIEAAKASSMSYALMPDGKAFAWGANWNGVFGNNTTADSVTPVPMGTYTDWYAISTDNPSDATCGIRKNGRLYCWGNRAWRTVADGGAVMGNQLTPVEAALGYNDWVEVEVESEFACARRGFGQMYCWGDGGVGRLGNGTTTNFNVPTQVSGNHNDWSDFDVGQRHTCGIRNNSDAYCWGEGTTGELGDGAYTDSTTPVLVGGGITDWKAVNSEGFITCGVTNAGRGYCWGNNYAGQIGDGTISNVYGLPTEISGAHTDWSHISEGDTTVCGIRSGNLYCWGDRTEGKIPDGGAVTGNQLTPALAAGGITDWAHVKSDGCGSTTSGKVYCWGHNLFYQVGDGTTVDRNTPFQVTTGLVNSCAHTGCTNVQITPNGRILSVDATGCAINAAGRLYCWGDNTYGSVGDGTTIQRTAPVQVSGNHTNWIQVSNDFYISCGIRGTGGEGTLYCWGTDAEQGLGNGAGVTSSTVPALAAGGFTDWTRVSVSSVPHWGVGLRANGRAYSWGTNTYGMLGVGDTATRHSPTEISGAHTDWLHVGSHGQQGCGIRGTGTSGTLYCWGRNNFGAVGDGSTTQRTAPVVVSGGFTDWTQVNGDYDHNCGVRANGRAYCWGYNGEGRLGDGTTTQRDVPTEISGAHTDWKMVAGSLLNSCGIRTSTNKLYCWGFANNGALGNGTNNPHQHTPVEVTGVTNSNWTTYAGGGSVSCAMKTGGEIYCWGENNNGQLGIGSLVSQNQPTRINAFTAPDPDNSCTTANCKIDITAMSSMTLALNYDGTGYAMGYNGYANFGDGTTVSSLVPTKVGGTVTDWSRLSGDTANARSCGISAGKLYCWGNRARWLGDGGATTGIQNTPVEVSGGFSDWTSVDVGAVAACAIRAGRLYCWGDGFYGSLGNGSTTDFNVPTEVSGAATDWIYTAGIDTFTCGIRGTGTSGTAYCWGLNNNGELGIGVAGGSYLTPELVSGGFTDWTMLSMETSHACGVRANGRAYCWGMNADGRLGDGSTTQRTVPTEVSGANTDWTNISAGNTSSCGIRGGRLYCWGLKNNGAMGDGTLTTGNQLTPIEVAGGFSDWKTVNVSGGHQCAARATGEYYCWGLNDAGQVGDGTTAMVLAPKEIAGINGCAPGETCSLKYPVAGDDTICSIASSGRLYCWGGGGSGALGTGGITSKSTPVEVHGGFSDWTAIDGNNQLMCGIRNQGKAYCWGLNNNGQIGDGTNTPRLIPTEVSGNLKFSMINADDGNGNACAITHDKKLYCWGDNAFGQVGDNTTVDKNVPTQVTGNHANWIWVTVQGFDSACGIRGSNGQGTAWCWGDGTNGKLGDGNSPTDSLVPVQVSGGFTDWTQVNSDGGGAVCGLRANGRAYCWGNNINGTLGDGTTTNRTVPTEVSGGHTDWTAIYANQASCGIRAGGRAFCWGLNNNGGIGDGTLVNKSVPTEVSGGFTDWYSIYAGARGACGARLNGTVWCWGPGTSGQIGNGTTVTTNKPTTAVTNIEPASSTGCPNCEDLDASAYGCSIAGNGELYCWGDNTYGQVGDGTTVAPTIPIKINALSGGWTDVARDSEHTCGIAGGRAYCWGHRTLGRIGDGGAVMGNQTTPKEVSGGITNWQAISVNFGHACGRTLTGKLYCWGENTDGQVGDGTTAQKIVPTEVQGAFSDWSDHTSFGAHTCGIRSGGLMYCWGYNNRGQIGDGTTGTSRSSPTLVLGGFTDWYKMGRGGHETTCGIRTTGNAYCWGNNAYGQMGDGGTGDASSPVEIAGAYTNWQAISTPYHASYGIRGGKLYAWGRRDNYEIPDGGSLVGNQTTPLQIGTDSDWYSVSQNYYAATRRNGKYYTWGTNSSGELGDGTTTDQNTPVEVVFASPRLRCATGSESLCAPDPLLGVDSAVCSINGEGRLFCWGANWTGELGDGTVAPHSTVPVEVSGGFTDWVWVDSTSASSCGVRATGAGYCWGLNADGQLGIGVTGGTYNTPQLVTGGYSWRIINNEDGFSGRVACGLMTSGGVRCWGLNAEGQIGDGTTVAKNTPTMVSGWHTDWTYVDPGDRFVCGLRSTTGGNAAWCWGDNSSGQLGNGTTTDSSVPVAVAGAGGAMSSAPFNDWVQISTGSVPNVCALRSNGRAYCWGYNGTGALGDGTTTDRSVPTEVMGAHTDWTMISPDNHSCGIRSGKLYCWGNDEFGKLGMGTVDAHRTTPGLVSGGYTDWTTVTPGWRGTCATRAGGAVWCWGRNGEGAVGNGTTTDSSIPAKVSNFTSRLESCPSCDVPVRDHILSSDKTTCMISKFGRAYCWGNNLTGQIGDGSSTDRLTPREVTGTHRNWIQISNDDAISCGIRGANGKGMAYCWGSRVNGGIGDGGATAGFVATPTLVAGGFTDWKQVKVESASRHVCATRASGKAYCWGNNTDGELGDNSLVQKTSPSEVYGSHNDWMYAGAQGTISCGIRSNNGTYGEAYCWGSNHTGAIGDGSFTQREIPTLVSGGFTDWTTITGNADFTCGMRRTGQAYCWGKNDYGQLGQGNTTDYNTPREVVGAYTDWSHIAAGSWHTCGVRTAENKLYCWGSNWEGAVGDNSALDRTSPVEVTGIANANWSRVAAGNSSTCGMKATGEVYCWGFNDQGQVGDNSTTQRNQPVLVANITASDPAKACSVGSANCTDIVPFKSGANSIVCAIDSSGQAWCWGTNDVGEVGNGTAANQYNSPTLVSGGYTDWIDISPEFNTTCGLRATGDAYCWGENTYGQVGDGTFATSTTPVKVSLYSDFVRIGSDMESTCAIRENGQLYCWGHNNLGALGDGTFVDKNVPTLVSGGFTDWTDVNVSWTSCGIRGSGSLYCWGLNTSGEVGNGVTGGTYNTPQLVSGGHTDWVMVDNSDNTNCGIRSNTRAYCWGEGSLGEVGDGAGVDRNVPTEVAGASTGWTNITSSYANSCGINAGRVYCWGNNTGLGLHGNNSVASSLVPVATSGGITDFTAISISNHATCATRSNKQLYCWGRGTGGALGIGSTSDYRNPRPVPNFDAKAQCDSCTPVQPSIQEGRLIDADGKAWAFGNNATGELGDGTTTNTLTPTRPSGIASGWTTIQGDSDTRVCGIANGRLYCWGNRAYYLGDGGATVGNQLTPIEASGAYSDWRQINVQSNRVCGTRSNATVWCFGDQPQGQFGISSTTTFNVPTASFTSFSDWVKVSTSEETVCGLRMGGTIYCAGADWKGGLGNGAPATNSTTPVLVSGGFSDWTFLADAETVTQCAIRANGSAYCWGGCEEAQCGDGTSGVGNNKMVPTEISGAHTNWQFISAGHFGGCGIRGNHGQGRAYCWGDRSVATMGDGGGIVGLVTSPTEVANSYTDWTFINQSGHRGCGARANGKYYCWTSGWPHTGNSNGNLGTGDTTNYDKPHEVVGVSAPMPTEPGCVSSACHTAQVEPGFRVTCWIASDTRIYCAGGNASGIYGNGNTTTSQVPITAYGGTTGWLKIANDIPSGGGFTCALRNTGVIQCAGENASGQLGNGLSPTPSTSPVTVSGGFTDWVDLDADFSHVCGLRGSGQLYCWGDNGNGRLGDNTIVPKSTPSEVNGTFTDWQSVSTGGYHTCGLRGAGTAYCWGTGANGRLGNGTVDSPIPLLVNGGFTDWKQIDAGNAHTCGLRANNRAYCWGAGGGGRIGDGFAIQRNNPTEISGAFTDWTDIEAGNTNSCGIRAGFIYCWGDRTETVVQADGGALTGTQTTPSLIQGGGGWTDVEIENQNGCAIKDDGSFSCWGMNDVGQAGIGNNQKVVTPTKVSTIVGCTP